MKGVPAKIGEWFAQLVLVFIGAYAAFWLSNYQEHQRQDRQRDQILASLELQLEEGLLGTKQQAAQGAAELREFQRALQNGERPRLRRFTFTTDYSPGDIATLLQAGGIEVLQLKTLITIREFETVVRWGLSRMAHYQKLSDDLIAPALGQDASFFYDDTARLRERFDFYPAALQARLDFYGELEQKQAHLLSQIKSERQKR
ncbi:MAG TPA: hypothetical protein VG095_03835 [Chthoniobacterales bacterium]|nr:hypothetical protein [Chthoniobacterales bacterium]